MLCDLVLSEAFSAQTTLCLARAEREITGLKDVSLLFASIFPLFLYLGCHHTQI